MPSIITSYATRHSGENIALLGVSSLTIALRTYARSRAVGFRHFAADDNIMLVAIAPIIFEYLTAYILFSPWSGIGNVIVQPDPATYSPGSLEYRRRIRESKLLVAYTVNYVVILWLMKGANLSLFSRFTHRLGHYESRIRHGFYILGGTFAIIILGIFLGCRPFRLYWQISPDPGTNCHPATAPINVFVPLAFDILTSVYILSIPLPILRMTNMKLWKKLGLITMVVGNIFVVVTAIVRAILIYSMLDDVEEAHCWTLRATFVSTVASNLPLLYPLMLQLLTRFSSVFPCTHMNDNERELRTITEMEEGEADVVSCQDVDNSKAGSILENTEEETQSEAVHETPTPSSDTSGGDLVQDDIDDVMCIGPT
ncbi:hypothetical protein F5Y16DRAFT_398266 [Xylariaceae sp. FL0255]|nr:hypothetical protein F5Y16DRAFT_398266 [Xylariaceae sp. FL0255]